jgi:hypothetical protein
VARMESGTISLARVLFSLTQLPEDTFLGSTDPRSKPTLECHLFARTNRRDFPPRQRSRGRVSFFGLASLQVAVSLVCGELEEAVSLAFVLRQATAAVSIKRSEICLRLCVCPSTGIAAPAAAARRRRCRHHHSEAYIKSQAAEGLREYNSLQG